ncbi:hypothetical protein T11_12221 [Trichinella zimbabwensis]|uniref:Uncharacterized protein n=1 Tax=Trichinella zimbabwensis TaxID=268475 RepID=A0A0V1HPW0_9BILA|nr:hypothetical protein T11_12221 [Trichinella zimbabwensis]
MTFKKAVLFRNYQALKAQSSSSINGQSFDSSGATGTLHSVKSNNNIKNRHSIFCITKRRH